jgi:vacuolar-type H+-ATPase subunit I/STV1
MMSPLLERHDYGICDQVERQMVELQNQGLLPEEMYNQNKDRIEDCKSRMDILQHRAKKQAKKIHEEELSKTKIKNLLIKNGLYNVKDEHIVDVREYMSDGYSLDRAINQVVLDYSKKQKNKKQEIDKLWGV